jgi:hypothetical protein
MRQLLAGMSPHSGVSQVPRALPVGLHKFSIGFIDTLRSMPPLPLE